MNVYETDDTWVPDSTYVNGNSGIEYIAWNIGLAPRIGKALWLIAPVVATPTQDLEDDILPVGYTTYEFNDDVIRYGHTRSVLKEKSVMQLEAAFIAEVAVVTQEVIDGYR